MSSQQKPTAQFPVQSAFEAIQEFCKSCGVDYTVQPRHLLVEFPCATPGGDACIRLQIVRPEFLEPRCVFLMRLEAPFRIPDNPKRFDVLDLLSQYNAQFIICSAALDFESGALACRISQLLTEAPLEVETIDRLFRIAGAAGSIVFQKVHEILNGKPEKPTCVCFPIGLGEYVSDEEEELVIRCLELIREENRASTPLLQRRLKLGYSKATRAMDILEMRGIVGPKNGHNDREILVDLNEEGEI